MRSVDLVNLLDGGSCTARCTTHIRHTTRGTGHTSRHATTSLVQLCDDWVAHTFHLFLLVAELLNLSKLVSIQPLDCFITLVVDLLSVILRDLVLQLFILDSCLHVEAVALQTILGRDSVLLLLIISLELFSIGHHALNLFLGESSLVISNGDLILFTSRLITSRHIQDTISIDIKGYFNLWHTTGCWWYTGQIKLAKQVVILGHSSLALVHLDGDGRLVIAVGGEGLGLLGGDSGVSLNE